MSRMKVRKFVEKGLDTVFGPRRRLGTLEQEILEELTAGDLLVSFLCSARSSRVMYHTALQRAKARYAIKQAIARLERDGFLKHSGKDEIVMLTTMGRAMVVKEARILRDAKKLGRKWDGAWRIVGFDIPKEYRTTRNALRQLLKRAGFEQMQKSVYIYPFPCEELVTLLRQDKRLAIFTFFCTTSSITADNEWRRKFRLV